MNDEKGNDDVAAPVDLAAIRARGNAALAAAMRRHPSRRGK